MRVENQSDHESACNAMYVFRITELIHKHVQAQPFNVFYENIQRLEIDASDYVCLDITQN